MADIKYEILKSYGVLSESAKGWKKELNLVKWNDRSAKLDVRDWAPDYAKMGKGLTFNRTEAMALKELLAGIVFDDID